MGVRRPAIGTAPVVVAVVVVITAGFTGILLSHSWSGPPSSTSTSTASTSAPTTYAVTFQQVAACSPPFWGTPWAVTINNVTKPAGMQLPITSLQGTTNPNLAKIVFALPDGSYQYAVSPGGGYFTPSSGSFRVSGSNKTIPIAYTGTSCTATTTPGAGT